MHHALGLCGLLGPPRVRVKSRSTSDVGKARPPTVKGATTTTELATSLMKPSSVKPFTALYSSASRIPIFAATSARVVLPSIWLRTQNSVCGNGCDLCLSCSRPLPVLLKTEDLSKFVWPPKLPRLAKLSGSPVCACHHGTRCMKQAVNVMKTGTCVYLHRLPLRRSSNAHSLLRRRSFVFLVFDAICQ